MRLLIVSPVFPWPLSSGAKVRIFHIIRGLHALGHEVGLVGTVEYREQEHIAQLAPYVSDMTLLPVPSPGEPWRSREPGLPGKCARVAREMLTGLPFAVARFHHPLLDRAVTAKEPDYDRIVVEFPCMAANISPTVRRRAPDKLVLVEHDIGFIPHYRAWQLAQGPDRVRFEQAYRSARKAELAVLSRFRHVAAMSAVDQELLRDIAPWTDVGVVPNGADTTAMPFVPARTKTDEPYLLYVGGLRHEPNFDAVRFFLTACLPLFTARFTRLRFVVAGETAGREDALTALAPGRVFFPGFVDDIAALHANAQAMIVPLRIAGGTRLKILEAMARGTPVISTTIGAEGLALVDGVHALLADTPEALCAAYTRLAGEPGLGPALAGHARELCENLYDWRRIAAAMTAWLAHPVRPGERRPDGQNQTSS